MDRTSHRDRNDIVHSWDSLKNEGKQQIREAVGANSLYGIHSEYDVPQFLKYPAHSKVPLVSMVSPP